MTPQMKISRCITKLMFSYPFWGALAIGTEFIEDPTIGTMATNGKWIKWDPVFVDKITEEECLGVIAHEIAHIIFKHMLRLGHRGHMKWNHACDYTINGILLREGFKLPEGGLWDKKYDGMMAEKVYELLPEPPQMPAWGIVIELTDADEAAELEVEIEQRIAGAAAVAKSRGKVPGFVKGLLEDMEEAQIDWKDKIRRFLTGDQPDDYTFRRPERKAYYHLGLIAPSVEGKGCGDIVIGVDSSGSVSDQELKHFLAEINAISTEVAPRSVTVIVCDAKVHSVQTFEEGEEITAIKVNGRGGTLVMPVFDYIEKNDLPVDHMIYLSDMEVGDYPKHVPFPLLWVSTGTGKAPIGETVRIKVK